MTRLLLFIDKLIPDPLKRGSIISRTKARILTCLLYFCTLTLLLIQVMKVIIPDEDTYPIRLVIALFFLQILLFYRLKNFRFSTHLLLITIAFPLAFATYNSGGMYSDNLLYLMMVPLLAFILLNVFSGMAWLFLLLGFHACLFIMEIQTGQFFEQAIYDPTYYYFALLFYFVILSLIIFYSSRIQEHTFSLLKVSKEQLNKQNTALEEYANRLETSQKDLMNSNKALQEFAYTVSHDLKQPLRNMTSFSNLLKKNLERRGVLDDESIEFLNFIQQGGVSMSKLINDLIEYSKLSADKGGDKTLIDFETLLAKVNFNLRKFIETEKVRIEWENLPKGLMGHEVKLLQLFQNLISNAIKFKKEDVPPVIKITAEENKEFWMISVEDNGMGIEEKYQDKVFDLFYKLHTSQKFNGSGIGLSTCKAIVEQHGGKIWVNSQKGIGSIFYFTIAKARSRKSEHLNKVYNQLITSH